MLGHGRSCHPADADVRRLVREMARANPLWGAPRIHGELLKLGFDVSKRTISRLMPRRPTPPSQTSRTFLENHLGLDHRYRLLRGADAYLSDPVRLRGPGSRPSAHPACECDAAAHLRMDPAATARGLPPRRERGRCSTTATRPSTPRSVGPSRLRAHGRLHSPSVTWQNPYVERVICSIRRECLDHVIVFSERHLRRVLRSYTAYYQRSRAHLALGKDAPVERAVQQIGRIAVRPEVGGRHHRYERRAV
jgi:hypothetical protein